MLFTGETQECAKEVEEFLSEEWKRKNDENTHNAWQSKPKINSSMLSKEYKHGIKATSTQNNEKEHGNKEHDEDNKVKKSVRIKN